MKIKRTFIGLIAVAALAVGGWEAVKWTTMRVYVGPDEALVVVNKFGQPLPPDAVVVPIGEERYKGIRQEVLGPGRYFFDPVEYSWNIVSQTQIPAGDPQNWHWDHEGNLADPSIAPMVGLVSMKQGKEPAGNPEVVDPGYRGIQKEVLTPGVYKINPYFEEVTLVPAIIIPPGSVGVVTRLVGQDVADVTSATLTAIKESTTAPATSDAAPLSRLVVGPNQRGILRDVLQPGIYYLNPRMVKVTIAPIGYDQINLDEAGGTAVRFYSNDGYLVEADFTIVWGRSPADVPNIVANIGDTKNVEQNVIEPAAKAACQNEGAKYTAKELIQGTTRSKFQDDLSSSLESQVSSRNIHILLALIRNIAIKDNRGQDATNGLLSTIQQANIEVEVDLTNKQKTETATMKANLEQALKLVDVARETVASDTNVKVANIMADGQKQAAEIAADCNLQVATIELQVAQLDAQKTQILGKAGASVDQMKRDAEAQGSRMMIDAFGSPQAYNMYTFAKNFDPTELKLIFAGPGTLWTDLKSFQDIGASDVIQGQTAPKKP
jgi:SPFH domain / Band 7 family